MRHHADETARGGWPRIAIVVVLTLGIALGVFATAWRASASPLGCAPISVASGDAKPGGTGWEPPATTTLPPVHGYANTTSAICGQRVTLYLGTRSSQPILVRISA